MHRWSSTNRRRQTAGLAVVALGTLGISGLFTPGTSLASSHREAPLIAGDPQVDNTDVYAFSSPDNPSTVTLIGNWIPFEEPAGGPNFYPWATDAHYDINIDNTGDGKPDLVYRWTFTSHYKNPATFLYNTGVVTSLDDPDLNFTQTYDLDVIGVAGKTKPARLLTNAPVTPSDVGTASMPAYGTLRTEGISTFPVGGGVVSACARTPVGCGAVGRSYAGQAKDSFFLDLRIFDLLYGANLSEVGNDTLKRYDVNTIALQLPKSAVALKGNEGRNPVIGVWSTTSRKQTRTLSPTNGSGAKVDGGGYVQVSRLGSPLVNEVVVPVGAKDRFNASTPDKDAQFAPGVLDPEVPKLIQAIYGIPAPATPRNDLVAAFLTGVTGLNNHSLNLDANPKLIAPSEMLRLNLSTPVTAEPNRLGVVGGDTQGFPNGRRLTDDVVDIELQALEGVLLPGHPAAVDTLGDGVNVATKPFGNAFPYVALPIPGSSTS